MIDLSKYIEPGLISKRFLLALVVIALFNDTPEVVAAVVFYYFGSHVTKLTI